MPRIINYWADSASNTGASYPAIVVTAGYKVTRVEVRGSIGLPTVTVTPPVVLGSETMWGIQAIPNGNTPLTLPADISNNDWLVTEVRGGTDILSAWTPAANSATLIAAGEISLTWSGQLKVSVDTAIMFTTGPTVGSPSGWWTFGSINVFYA
jgi:hypothetical protein